MREIMITTRYCARNVILGAAIGLVTVGLTGCGKKAPEAESVTITASPRAQTDQAVAQSAPVNSGSQYSTGPGGLRGNTNFGAGSGGIKTNTNFSVTASTPSNNPNSGVGASRFANGTYNTGPGGLHGNTSFAK
jgi:hypothetical protein